MYCGVLIGTLVTLLYSKIIDARMHYICNSIAGSCHIIRESVDSLCRDDTRLSCNSKYNLYSEEVVLECQEEYIGAQLCKGYP